MKNEEIISDYVDDNYKQLFSQNNIQNYLIKNSNSKNLLKEIKQYIDVDNNINLNNYTV